MTSLMSVVYFITVHASHGTQEGTAQYRGLGKFMEGQTFAAMVTMLLGMLKRVCVQVPASLQIPAFR